jgi:hypothetical protein
MMNAASAEGLLLSDAPVVRNIKVLNPGVCANLISDLWMRRIACWLPAAHMWYGKAKPNQHVAIPIGLTVAEAYSHVSGK